MFPLTSALEIFTFGFVWKPLLCTFLLAVSFKLLYHGISG